MLTGHGALVEARWRVGEERCLQRRASGRPSACATSAARSQWFPPARPGGVGPRLSTATASMAIADGSLREIHAIADHLHAWAQAHDETG